VVKTNILGLYFTDGNKIANLKGFGFFSLYLDFNPVLFSLRVTVFFLAGPSHSNIFGYVVEIVLNLAFSIFSAATAERRCVTIFFSFETENDNQYL